MNNNAWFKKENPFQTVIGYGGGATGFQYHSSAATKTYLDDVFSTYLYPGNSSNRSITTGIDLAGEGGMVWTKDRANSNWSHFIADTARGVNKRLISNSTSAEDTQLRTVTAFNSDGHSLGADDTTFHVNNSSGNYSSWTFRKQKGFFDVVTWTGNGSSRTISHSLDSVPGMIIVKNTSSSIDWTVWHRGAAQTDATNTLTLNSTGATATNNTYFDNGSTPPTSTNFTVHTSNRVNADGDNYVAYVFAGGESTAATAVSVDFDGNDDLDFAASSDLQLGTGDFTVEGWFKYDDVSTTPCIFDFRAQTGPGTDGFACFIENTGTGRIGLYYNGGWICNSQFQNKGQWYHFAAVKSSGTISLYINGTKNGTSYTSSTDFTNNTLRLAAGTTGANLLDGSLTNIRVVKGTALYTSSFKPPTEPLTNITNTKVLCCNNSSVTGGTVLPNTPTATGDPTASTDSPFDDPDGFKFGADSDNLEGIIKTGKYIGNGSSTAVDINIGWEPQWLLIKCIDLGSENWFILDSMRGIVSGGVEATLSANTVAAEADINSIDLTPTGFKTQTADDKFNGDGHEYIYMAIRKPDGYVGKLPSAGTDVFAMDTGNASTTIPVWDSNFPVDFAMNRNPAAVQSWYTSARLMQDNYVLTNDSTAANQDGGAFFDSNVGWAKDAYGTWGSTYQSWMWKQHPKGFDVVTYTGGGTGDIIPHNLNAVPEMMWVKNMSAAQSWAVYHKGLNGGTNPEQYYQMLNSPLGTNTLGTETNRWNDIAPTATHFSVGGSNNTGNGGDQYIAMLFASANNADGDPISKVGYYTGDNTSDGSKVITLGFQPRFIVIKASNAEEVWVVLDTLRGIQTGANDQIIYFDRTDAQVAGGGVDLSATGFSLRQASGEFNANGYNYLYYAHA